MLFHNRKYCVLNSWSPKSFFFFFLTNMVFLMVEFTRLIKAIRRVSLALCVVKSLSAALLLTFCLLVSLSSCFT